MRCHLPFLFLVLTACPGDDEDAPPIAVPPADARITAAQAEFLLPPGSTTTLSISVTGPDGALLPNVSVLFVAPERGPSGRFGSPDAVGPWAERVLTDGQGRATVSFTTEDEGVFLVDAYLEQTQEFATFAISAIAGQAPSRSAEDVRTQIAAEYAGDLEEGLLFGPVLLPAGTEIYAGFEEDPVQTVTQDTWFSWLDHRPTASYGHPTTFLLSDATSGTNSSTTAMVWPQIKLPNAESQGLVPPIRNNVSLLSIFNRTDDTTASLSRGLQTKPGHCAIVVDGPEDGLTIHGQNVVTTVDFFTNEYGASYVYYKQHPSIEYAAIPASFADLQGFVRAAKNAGCTTLFVYLNGHGTNEKFEGAEEHPTIDLAGPQNTYHGVMVRYLDIAELLANHFAESNVTVNVILQSCFAERAIAEFQGWGLRGEIFAATRRDLTTTGWTMGSPLNDALGLKGSHFTSQFFEKWKTLGTNKAPAAAFVRLQTHVESESWDSESVNPAEYWLQREPPVAKTIKPDWTDWDENLQEDPTPDISMNPGETVELTIVRPHSNRGVDSTSMWIETSVESPIARFDQLSPDTFAHHKMTLPYITLSLAGLQPGTTTYTVKSRAKWDAYEGTGTITVHGLHIDRLDPDHGRAGDTVEIHGGGITVDNNLITVRFEKDQTKLSARITGGTLAPEEDSLIMVAVDVPEVTEGGWEVYLEQGEPGSIATSNRLSFRASAPPQCALQDLGLLNGGDECRASSINDSGWIVGSAKVANGDRRGFIWKPGVGMTALSNIVWASTINNSGTIVGSTSGQTRQIARICSPPAYDCQPPDDCFDPPCNNDESGVFDINDSGTYVGFSWGIATKWDTTGYEFLRESGASSALGINNAGSIVGRAQFPCSSTCWRAFWYEAGVFEDLGPIGTADWSNAADINEAGIIVGHAVVGPGHQRPVWWTTKGGTPKMEVLGYVEGKNTTRHDYWSSAINDHNQAVGHFSPEDPYEHTNWHEFHSFLYLPAEAYQLEAGMHDLTVLTATNGWQINDANDINDAGQVVGVMTRTTTTAVEYHCFLLDLAECQ